MRDPKAPHVDREAWTVQFPPTVVATFDGITTDIAKIVGVSDDHDLVEKTESGQPEEVRRPRLGRTARSPTTSTSPNPEANKGAVVDYLSANVFDAARSRSRRSAMA